MSTSVFPGAIDSPTDPSAGTLRAAVVGISPAAVATLTNDAVVAIETKVGVTNSTVATTLDYKVSLLGNSNAFLTDTGSANTYILTPSPAIAAYAIGQRFMFYPANGNSGASTLNVNGLGTKAIQFGGYAVPINFLTTGIPAQVIYDGTAFQLLNPATKTIGYAQITTSYTTASFPQDVPSVAATVNIPSGGARIKITVLPGYIKSTATAGTTLSIYIREGSTVLGTALVDINTSSYAHAAICEYTAFVTGGAHSYKVTVDSTAAGTYTFGTAGPAGPAFILIELV